MHTSQCLCALSSESVCAKGWRYKCRRFNEFTEKLCAKVLSRLFGLGFISVRSIITSCFTLQNLRYLSRASHSFFSGRGGGGRMELYTNAFQYNIWCALDTISVSAGTEAIFCNAKRVCIIYEHVLQTFKGVYIHAQYKSLAFSLSLCLSHTHMFADSVSAPTLL